MGNWGPGNLDGDGPFDILFEQSKTLIDETLQLAASKSAAEFDEYDHDRLFVNFETIFTLKRAHLLHYHPEPDVVIPLKGSYLAAWDAYVKENKAEWDERRTVIAKTFDQLIWICQREQDRRESGPTWVEVKAPTIAELSSELSFMPHLVFDNLHLLIPNSWKAEFWSDFKKLPPSSLTQTLIEENSGRFTTKSHQFLIERFFYASGESLVPELVSRSDDPYLLVARLHLVSGKPPASAYFLVRDTQETLSPNFQGAGEHVSGAVCMGLIEAFEFDGLETFRHVKPGPDWGTQLRYQHLYYHSFSKESFLLLEFGSIRDNVDLHFPDKVLLDHIVQSLRVATNG